MTNWGIALSSLHRPRAIAHRTPRVSGPRMPANAAGNRRHPWPPVEIDRHPAGLRELLAIELQPARGAAARQPTARNDDVRLGAGADEGAPFQSIATSGWQESASAG